MVKVIHQAASASDQKGQKTADILRKIEKESIEEQAAILGRKHNLTYIDLHIFPLDPDDIYITPEVDARRLGLTIFHKKQDQVRFAVVDPARAETMQYIEALCKERGWQYRVYVCSQPSLERAHLYYSKKAAQNQLDLLRVSLQGEDLERFEQDFSELASLKENPGLNTSRAMEIILAGARKMQASDIHIEPEEKTARLRFRLDGVLHDIGNLQLHTAKLLLSRIKMIGKMRLNVRTEAQDGHFFVTLENKRLDIRVSCIPGKHGETLTLRILSNDDIQESVETLGLRGLALEEVLKQSERPHGLIINTGPTGSGKTTTLYAVLRRLNVPGVKIITVEDPIEYSLAGIVQTQVSKNKSYTFATALRAIVRQDPDIILVGEIRDDETTDISINAALTGHMVLATLHANSAAAAVPRMVELSAKPTLISTAVTMIIAQRLVRRLCVHCRESYVPAKETVDAIMKIISIISPKAKISLPTETKQLWRAVGCPKCLMSGYRGRIGIFEVYSMSEDIAAVINNMGTEQEILKVALEGGMVTMTQDGILKALEGLTALDEVWRVTGQVEVLTELYAKLMPSELSRASEVPTELIEQVEQSLSDIKQYEKFVTEIDSMKRLRALFAGAILLKAGDMHIEPTGKEVEIRYRIDGILRTVCRFPKNEYPALLSEIKLLGGMKSGERAGVADSRFSIVLEKYVEAAKGNRVDIRLSIILGGFGETAVLRFLNQGAVSLSLDNLNIRKEHLDRIMIAASKPNGVIINTGPTGSGKTTTLYSLLSYLNKPEIKIITVEDPIEYQLSGILQTQVNTEEGYTFATALRSLLRQNPDIMMIGEIRDNDTAEIAIQAANTGHLVLSTLHANSAAGVVSRFLSMGVRSDDLANAAVLFIAQRLVRRLCDQCKEAIPPPTEEKALIDKILSGISPKAGLTVPKSDIVYRPKGCPVCGGLGYRGQMMICETLLKDRVTEEIIARGGLVSEFEEAAIASGMITIVQDGVLSVLEGKTTLDEIRRVTVL